ncbi:hypothetical protein J056_001154 [Wallemia ichthyophaga EXF-994]|uniref:Ubiquitin-like domain-containing protein n=1 Tax=Wallemia ichthyophaga (strain EXF-994 / CBS 113033) TaxID=1299270 RepID=R9ADN9_WALI9|nr:uncharacterized protein J056_001154 [Wallemia ichthyophaga EXF-994]EOR00268.1 hypothetical protein J056_001154 [Wallemia ichthyophaga EXF-994]
MVLNINKKINFNYKASNIQIPFNNSSQPLYQLLEKLSTQLSIPQDQFKLIYKGLVIRDSSRSLDDLKISNNSTIMVLVNHSQNIDKQQQLVNTIENILNNNVLPLQPQLEQFESSPTEQSKLVLQELLLQSILKLDSIILPSEFNQARDVRKHSIKTTQSFLDRLDNVSQLK